MGFWNWWFRDRSQAPWGPGPPILERIREWDGHEPLVLLDQESEPVDEIPFANGALDGILTHHTRPEAMRDQGRIVAGILGMLRALGRTGKERRRRALYRLAMEVPVTAYADALIGALARERPVVLESLRAPARWLAETATHREPLKLATILLGSCGDQEDLERLVTLARHDEFTLFAVVAVGNLMTDPTDVWWTMARNVHGWGKIQVVERLCGRVDDRPEIQDWLLRHGCENEILPEYLACFCARAGRLARALATERPDKELLASACLIFRALLSPGPAEDLGCYEDGVAAATALIGHLETQALSPECVELLATLNEWLESPGPAGSSTVTPTDRPGRSDPWPARQALGWTPLVREELARRCRNLLGPSDPDRVDP